MVGAGMEASAFAEMSHQAINSMAPEISSKAAANLTRTSHNGGMVKAKALAPRKPMSNGHKAALARGRAESACVRHYLEALETSKPKRGRKRTPASIDKRLAAIDTQLAAADALTKLHLLQEQKDLTDERLRVAKVKDLSALEKQFIKVAQAYGKRKGISYGTWRAAGVSANVLEAAGISRARS
jgi:hypothetical protein